MPPVRLIAFLIRIGLLPRPPIAASVAPSDLSSSIVIKPDDNDQISLGKTKVDLVKNVAFAKGLAMDIQVPQSATPRPLVVYVTGGGFIMAPKDAALDLRTFVAEAGFVVASVQYRTIRHKATYRDGIADVKAAIRYLRANAAKYQVDPRKVAVWGESAGGYLAAMAGLDQDSDVQAVVVKFGTSDVSKIGADFDPATQEELLSGDNLLKYFGTRAGTRELDVQTASTTANPATYARESAPPFLIMHGSQDHLVSPSQTLLLHNALRAARANSTRYVLHGANHGDLSFLGDEKSGLAWSTNQAMGLIVEFLRNTVGN